MFYAYANFEAQPFFLFLKILEGTCINTYSTFYFCATRSLLILYSLPSLYEITILDIYLLRHPHGVGTLQVGVEPISGLKLITPSLGSSSVLGQRALQVTTPSSFVQ